MVQLAVKLNQVRQWFHAYVVFTKPIFFILGLIFSYALLEKTFFDILITRVADVWKKYDLGKATTVVNLQEGTAAVLLPFFAYVADVRTGRFKMVVFSTAVCVAGLSLNILAARNEDNEQVELGLFYFALGLLTLSQAAHTVTLQAFLDDQLLQTSLAPAAAANAAALAANTADAASGNYAAIESGRRRSKFWWNLVSFVATVFAIFGPLTNLEFWIVVIVLTSVMVSSFVVFLSGSCYYNIVDKIEDPFKNVRTVIRAAIHNRRVEYVHTPEELFENYSGEVHILPRVPWLRWLDRAAILRGSQRLRPPNVEKVSQVKRLMKMLPLWSCFLTLSLVAASGSTFFIDEATSIAGDDLRPVLLLTNLLTGTAFVVSEISSYALNKLQDRYKLRNRQKMELWRIGIGMSLCVPCCIAAWANSAAARRRHKEGGSMRVYLLTPQYLLLGMTEGLSGEGLQRFYESQVLESLFRFGPPFGEFVMGVGKFLSILCILAFHRRPFRWFGASLDDSRLDKYYIFLAVLSSVNVGIYSLVACWYADDSFLMEKRDEEIGVLQQQAGTNVAAASQLVPRNRLLSRRPISNREGIIRSSSGGIGQEKGDEEETGEKPLLPSESNKNSTYNKLEKRDEEMGVLQQLARTDVAAASQPVPHNRSLSRRPVSNPEGIIRSSSGGIGQEEGNEEETGEKPLLPSESNKNSTYNKLEKRDEEMGILLQRAGTSVAAASQYVPRNRSLSRRPVSHPEGIISSSEGIGQEEGDEEETGEKPLLPSESNKNSTYNNLEKQDEEMGILLQRAGTSVAAASQHVPRNRSLSRRPVSNPEGIIRSSYGGIGQEEGDEEETGEKPLLPSESNKNPTYNKLEKRDEEMGVLQQLAGTGVAAASQHVPRNRSLSRRPVSGRGIMNQIWSSMKRRE